ncbi:hypothetical protein OG749_24370 [Streptomyces nojiriensis]
MHALLLVSTIDTDPGLRRTKQSNSTDRQFSEAARTTAALRAATVH